MALIFFEGFNSPSGADSAYWSFANGVLGFTAVQLESNQSALYKANPRTYTGGYQPGVNTPTAAATLTLPTAHSGNKTVYIGCGLRANALVNTAYYGIGVLANNQASLFTIKNSAGTHVIDIAFALRPDWSYAAPSINLGVVLKITQTVNTVVTTVNFRVPASAMQLYVWSDSIVIQGSQRADNCHYFEFKLDFQNNQFAARYNDQLLGLHSDTNVKYTTLAATSMQKLVLHVASSLVFSGYPLCTPSFQDLYIADDTGSGVVSWLGADTHVVQPLQAAPVATGWLTSGSSTGGAVINSADGDATFVYTKTMGANQTYAQANTALWPTVITNIAAVKVSSVARGSSVASALRHLHGDSNGSITPISAILPLTDTYAVQNTQRETNPNTFVAWTKADIETSAFGVQSVANSLSAALTPTFGTPVPTADGFLVSITNYDDSYTWAGTATESGAVTIAVVIGDDFLNGIAYYSGDVIVTGLSAETSSTATITTTKLNTVSGSAQVTATSVAAAALIPTFGAPTKTATGFTVQITNYNAAYEWAGTATASGSVVVSGTGLVWVAGVAANTSSTATITATAGSTVGSATVTATSLSAVMTMMTVGNPYNVADPRPGRDSYGGTLYGAVNYSYKIGKYPVTVSQYTAFLNAVSKTDPTGLYNIAMAGGVGYGTAHINRSGSSGNYTYTAGSGMGNFPMVWVNWFDCARFANWMSNGQPNGAQGNTTTERGAYTIVSGAVSGSNFAQNTTNPNTGLAPTYRLPTENEWYKAAYYSPNYGGTGVAGYWTYATQSDTAPGTTIGSSANQARYNGYELVPSTGDLSYDAPIAVGSFTGSGSFYGTFDQTGNVEEWNDLDGTAGGVDATGVYRAYLRGQRGGDYYDQAQWITYANNGRGNTSKVRNFGFRLAGPV